VSGNIRRIAPNLLQRYSLGGQPPGVLNRECQQAILNRMQSHRLTVQHHYLVAQMHKQVFITIELLVPGRRRRLHSQSDAILHGAGFEAQRPPVASAALCYIPVATALDARVLNSWRSIRTAAVSLSDRTTRPAATNCSGHVWFSVAGQFTATSTSCPGCSRSLVVNRIPPLLISSVFPDPLTCTAFDCGTLYRTSSFTGYRLCARRSTVTPKFLPLDPYWRCCAWRFRIGHRIKAAPSQPRKVR
jgi:hypothetical protein